MPELQLSVPESELGDIYNRLCDEEQLIGEIGLTMRQLLILDVLVTNKDTIVPNEYIIDQLEQRDVRVNPFAIWRFTTKFKGSSLEGRILAQSSRMPYGSMAYLTAIGTVTLPPRKPRDSESLQPYEQSSLEEYWNARKIWNAGDAACEYMDEAVFKPSVGKSNLLARYICGHCAITDECLDIEGEELSILEVRGGLTATEQRTVRALYESGASQEEVDEAAESYRKAGFFRALQAYRTKGLG